MNMKARTTAMQDKSVLCFPTSLHKILERTQKEVPSFTDAKCDSLTGILLRTLVASKPQGMLLELGAGTGIATSWIADGMPSTTRLITVEKRKKLAEIAIQTLGDDQRITFLIADAETYILSHSTNSFDFIFADTSAGKYFLLDETLRLLKPGGIYVIDHLHYLPPMTQEEMAHATRVDQTIAALEQRSDIHLTIIEWSTKLLVATKK